MRFRILFTCYRELIETSETHFNKIKLFKSLINTMEQISMNGSGSIYQGGHIGNETFSSKFHFKG